ncbi:MAG: hypothetical protein SXG53_11640 [Pseudomonadota bacterium]|nr:hypothetical protein [Pseudomonadota bacterium]
MDRTVVIAVLLLVGLTWLLYKLTVFLEPKADQPAQAESKPESSAAAREPLHQRLRK